MKRQIKGFGLILLCMVLLTACQKKEDGSAVSSGSGKLLFLQANGEDTFLKSISDAAEAYAEKNSVDLTVEDAQNSVETQVQQMKEAKAAGYAAVICTPADAETSQQLIAAADGLPVVFVNRSPESNLLEKNKYVYVGSDENKSGSFQAEFLTDYFKGKSEIKAVLLRGVKTETAAITRSESVKEGLKKAGFEVEYVFDDTANWSREEAKKTFGIFLELKQEFDCVICNNDDMALGVLDACKEKGVDPSAFPIVGVDATEGGKQAIKDGDMDFTVLQSASGQGEMAIQAAQAIVSGKGMEDLENATEDGCYIWVPFEKVDSSSLK